MASSNLGFKSLLCHLLGVRQHSVSKPQFIAQLEMSFLMTEMVLEVSVHIQRGGANAGGVANHPTRVRPVVHTTEHSAALSSGPNLAAPAVRWLTVSQRAGGTCWVKGTAPRM